MMQLLPNQILDWINPEKFNLDNYLDYSDELHDLHNDYLLAAEKIKVAKKMLSEYQLQIIEDNGFSPGKNEKLAPDLGNKKMQTPFSKLKTLFTIRIKIEKIQTTTIFKTIYRMQHRSEGRR